MLVSDRPGAAHIRGDWDRCAVRIPSVSDRIGWSVTRESYRNLPLVLANTAVTHLCEQPEDFLLKRAIPPDMAPSTGGAWGSGLARSEVGAVV